MKTVITTFFLFLFLAGFGQTSTGKDAYIRVTYLGYSNGRYAIKVDNLQGNGCNPDVNFTWDAATKITAITPNNKNNVNYGTVSGSTTTFYFTGPLNPSAVFHVTDETICTWEGSSPSTITVTTAALTDAPITFAGPVVLTWQDDAHTRLMISFTVATISGINQLQYQVRKGNGAWVTVAVTVPSSTLAGQTFSTIVNL